MDCREMQLLISLRLDGELSKDEQAALAGHLAGCEACCREAALQERLSAALRELGREEAQAPPELCGLVMSRLAAGRRPVFAWLPAAWRKAVASAAAVLILAGGAAGVTAGLKMAGGGKMIVFETPAKTDAGGGGSAAQLNEAASGAGNPVGPPGQESAPDSGQKVLAPADGKGSGAGSPGLTGKEANSVAPGGSGGSTSAPVETPLPAGEPRALLNSSMKITSTVLKVAVGDLTEARAKAVALAAGAGAATQVFPEQGGGKKIVVIRIAAETGRAKAMIAELAQLGTVTDRQDESRDVTALYNEAMVQYSDLQARLNASSDPAGRQQLEAQAASYKRQLEAWEAEAGKHIIMLWLEGS